MQLACSFAREMSSSIRSWLLAAQRMRDGLDAISAISATPSSRLLPGAQPGPIEQTRYGGYS
jgi:hypothetical protein